MSVSNELKELRGKVSDLKREVSDLTNEVSKWQRKAVAAEKAQVKAEDKAAAVPYLKEKIEVLEVQLKHANSDLEGLQAQADKVEQVLEDVAALKRLAG